LLKLLRAKEEVAGAREKQAPRFNQRGARFFICGICQTTHGKDRVAGITPSCRLPWLRD
jgi:hypothetical protein